MFEKPNRSSFTFYILHSPSGAVAGGAVGDRASHHGHGAVGGTAGHARPGVGPLPRFTHVVATHAAQGRAHHLRRAKGTHGTGSGTWEGAQWGGGRASAVLLGDQRSSHIPSQEQRVRRVWGGERGDGGLDWGAREVHRGGQLVECRNTKRGGRERGVAHTRADVTTNASAPNRAHPEPHSPR